MVRYVRCLAAAVVNLKVVFVMEESMKEFYIPKRARVLWPEIYDYEGKPRKSK